MHMIYTYNYKHIIYFKANTPVLNELLKIFNKKHSVSSAARSLNTEKFLFLFSINFLSTFYISNETLTIRR